jgi:hypothetical protein
MSRETATKAGAGAIYMRALRQRRQAGLQRLPSPWAWLGQQGAQALVQQAYRTASWTMRPDQDSAQLSDTQQLEAFALCLANDFKVLLMDAARQAGCTPAWWGEFDEDAADLVAQVPAAWRPEYPQFAQRTAEHGGMGAVAPMATGRTE